jgi:hypothetical protein
MTDDNVLMVALARIGITSLHQAHQAVANEIPDSIVPHVLGEIEMGTLTDKILTAAATALVSRVRRQKETR